MAITRLNRSRVNDAHAEDSLARIDALAAELAAKAAEAINLFLSRRISLEQLISLIQQTGAGELLAECWGGLARRPDAAPCLEILQVIASLQDQAAYQVERYGANSLSEDREQLASALARLEARRQTRVTAR